MLGAVALSMSQFAAQSGSVSFSNEPSFANGLRPQRRGAFDLRRSSRRNGHARRSCRRPYARARSPQLRLWKVLSGWGRLGVMLACGVAVAGAAWATTERAIAPPRFHPRRVLVQPRDGKAAEALMNEHRAAGREVLRVFPRLGSLQVVQLGQAQTVQQTIKVLQADARIAWAEPDHSVSAAGVLPNDAYFQNGTQWALNNYGQGGGLPDADLDAPEAWDVRRAASNVVVAVVDSGVRPTHEDLADNLWRNPLDGTPGFNALTGQPDPWDDNGHGTHLAGIIAAVTDNGRGIAGVAWRAQLMVCKFLDSAGNGYYSDAIACIEFARSNGAHILNLSWGGGELSAALSNALWAARADGLLLVAAAGNNAANTDLTPYYPASLPLDNLVAVAASTRSDERYAQSSYGPGSVDLFAPGAAIQSTARSSDAAYETRSGTSMAAAHVSGALALLRAQYPTAPPQHLIAQLLKAVDSRPAFARLCASGGRLNLRKALDQPTIAPATNALPPRWQITGLPGHPYVVAASTNFSAWQPLATNTLDGTGRWLFEDATARNLPCRFYCAQPAP